MDRWLLDWIGWQEGTDYVIEEETGHVFCTRGTARQWSASCNPLDWQWDVLPKVLEDLHLSHLFAVELNAIMNPDGELRFITEAHWVHYAKSTAGQRAEALWRAVNQ